MAGGIQIHGLQLPPSGTPGLECFSRLASLGFDTAYLGAVGESEAERLSSQIGAARERGLELMVDLEPDGRDPSKLRRLLSLGFTRFRCVAATATPPLVWRSLIEAAKSIAPRTQFVADTLGRPLADLRALAGAGFDFLFDSVGWWNLRDPWFFEQDEVVWQVGRPLGTPVAPPETSAEERMRRYLFASLLTAGVLVPADFESVADGRTELESFMASLNRLRAAHPVFSRRGQLARANAPGEPIVALVRSDFGGEEPVVLLLNQGQGTNRFWIDQALHRLFGWLFDLVDVTPGIRGGNPPGPFIELEAGEFRILLGAQASGIRRGQLVAPQAHLPPSRLVIEAVRPQLDGGRFGVKRVQGEHFKVSADVFRDGHSRLSVNLCVKEPGESDWRILAMRGAGNDTWEADVLLDRLGRIQYTVEAWTDTYASWRQEALAMRGAGQAIGLELREGRILLLEAAERAGGVQRNRLLGYLEHDRRLGPDENARADLLLSDAVFAAISAAPDKSDAVSAPILQVIVDRELGAFSAWYELFPRSQGSGFGKSGSFDDCIRRLPDIRALGFDILYLTPIHPVGEINRKGPDNTAVSKFGDPGSPYAIGSRLGGHTAVEPQLGTLSDFRRLNAAAHANGLELALDFAVQCAPDHPWLKEHPSWFHRRPDGTFKYAENPPKKYEDIVNVDFDQPDWRGLWNGLLEVVLFWVDEGVRIFRVDNPHTKPFAFWEWLIREVQRSHPDVIFLSEAFTRPKVMRRLAKLGFTQSYTYFTWRSTKRELTEYMAELTAPASVQYFRPNFFTNTPDILPFNLQSGGRPAFRIRLALAALLSGNYGIYSGFELCEAGAVAGREEYANSEKYQFKVRDWNAPGNIKDDIARLNQLRRTHPAFRSLENLRFHEVAHESVLCFSKDGGSRSNSVFAVVTLNPLRPVECEIVFPLRELGIAEGSTFATQELYSGWRQEWTGARHWITLNPANQPALVWTFS